LDLGRVLIAMGKRQMGEALIQNVLVSAKKVHDRPMVIHALHRLSAAAWFNGDLEQAERLASEGLMSAVGPELAQCKAEMLMTISVVQASRGQLAAATSGLTEAVSIFQGLRYKRERALCLCNLAELLTWQSDLGEAIRRCTEGAALARDVLFGQCEAFAHRVRATALMEAGDEAGAAQDLGIALATCMRHGLDDEMLATRFQAGRLALHRGMVDDAVRELQLALDAAIKRDTESYAPVVRATLARAFALQGRPEVAQPLLDAVEPVIETLALPRQTELMLAVAEACHTLNQQDTARHLARQAAQQAAIRGFRAWALQGRVLLVQLTTGEEREKAKMEARALADMVGETLSDELGVSFEAKIRACFDT